jgi:MFS transporter, Spinster family, sphingosine-1-phosphate transporter
LETRILLILTSLNLLDYLDRYLVAALGSPIKAELELSGKAFGFLNTAFLLVYFVTAPVFGYLGDRYGRHRLMAGGAVLWSLATSLTYWVTTYPTLLLTRGLVGVGEASFGTLAPAYLADVLPLERRSRALGLFYLAIPLGAALAYLAGGFIGKHFGWRPAFLVAGIPGLLLALAIRRLPATPTLPRSAVQDVSAGFTSPLASFRALWSIPTLRLVTLGYGMLTFTLGGLAFWMPQYLEKVKGLTMAQSNYLLFGAIAVAGTLGTLAGGILGSRLHRLTPSAPLWVSGVGIMMAWPLAALVIFSPLPALYLPSLVVAIFLLFLHPGVITAVIVSVARPGLRGQAVALNIIIIHLVGDAPSTFLIGWTADHFGLTWGVALTLVALALAAVLILTAIPHLIRDLERAQQPPTPENHPPPLS